MSRMNRRIFLASGVGTGLTLAFALSGCGEASDGPIELDGGEATPLNNAWLEIGTDETVTVRIAQVEFGQGPSTAFPQIVADELGAKWETVRFELAIGDTVYLNPLIYDREQITGGSTGMIGFFEPVRTAAAAAREMLVAAAAAALGVSVEGLVAEEGAVRDPASGRSLSFGELTAAAAKLTVPEAPTLKPLEDRTIIGQSKPRLDSRDKVTGAAVYATDYSVPDMLHGAVIHAPVYGSKPKTYDKAQILAMPGVVDVVEIDAGLGVVADSYWRAHQAALALDVEWTEVEASKTSSDLLRQRLETLADETGFVALDEGDVDAAIADASTTIEADYFVPYLAHATMEPQSAIAHVTDDGIEVWSGTQGPTYQQRALAKWFDVPLESVVMHPFLAGGGFGRRGMLDFVLAPAELSKAVGRPVKTIWSREEDIRHDAYRPAMLSRMRAALGEDGKVAAWHQRLAGPSPWRFSRRELTTDAFDPISVDGATDTRYGYANWRVESVMMEPEIPVGFWRSVGYSYSIYFTECFLDELAAAAGQDPYLYRRSMLADDPRGLRVLDRAAELAGWTTPLAPGRFRGIAFYHSERWQTPSAHVVEISVADGAVKIESVTGVIDCGLAINPEIVRAQIEGGTVFGLTAGLWGKITQTDGVVDQSNFHDYRLMQLDEAPPMTIEVLETGGPIGAVGEIAVPSAMSALANAASQALGKPVRSLPLSDYKFA